MLGFVHFLEHFARGCEPAAKSRPMPTDWLPWPGKMKVWTGIRPGSAKWPFCNSDGA